MSQTCHVIFYLSTKLPDLNYEAKFSVSHVVFQELFKERMIGSACERKGLYFFKYQATVKGQAKVASGDLLSFPNDDEIRL